MRTYFNYAFLLLMILGSLFLLPNKKLSAQSYQAWYNNAQDRIDTLRKNDYGIQIFDKDGQPYSGEVSVRMKKHEFPFGAAFDFYEGDVSMGNVFTTNDAIQAEFDVEIYRTERWDKYLAYAIPAEIGKEYRITLKFAEIFHGGNNARVFDVHVNGVLFLEDFDTHAMAGGKNIAIDTSLVLTATSTQISIELNASIDNVAIKGIVVEEIDGDYFKRINCGGSALVTSDGNQYISEAGYFDPNVKKVASREDWMKAAMYKYYNAGVSGNSFKWSGIQPRHTAPDYTNFDNAVRWTQKVGWDLRAHTLLWGGDDDHSMPGWVRSLPTTQAIIDTCKMRVIREVTRYRGIIKDYDVMNEPLTNHADWLRNTVGDSIIWESFKWARSADPDAELYINDYNVEYNWGQAEEYRDLVLQMLENGAPVTGVGMQAHFWDCCRPNINELVHNVNIVAQAGLPIKFTEYDYGGNLTQAQQASDYIMVLTIAFSHPSIVGLYHWGISDEGAWRENTGFFDSEYRPKLAADTLLYYTKTKWATNFDSLLSDVETLVFNAYHGNYEIEVDFDGVVKVFEVPLLKANADSVFVLHEAEASLKGPQLLETMISDEQNKVQLVFDKPIESSSIRRNEFKFFSTQDIGLESVSADSENPNVLILSLSKNIGNDSYVSVSYFPGSLKASDGSIASPFGPERVIIQSSEPDPDPDTDPDNNEDPDSEPDDDDNPDSEPDDNEDPDSDPDTDTNSMSHTQHGNIKVYPNPASEKVNILFGSAPFSLNVYNSMGTLVYSAESEKEIFTIDVSNYNRGMYLIQISDKENNSYIQKAILK